MVPRDKLSSQYVIYIKRTLLTLYLLQFVLCPNLTDKTVSSEGAQLTRHWATPRHGWQLKS